MTRTRQRPAENGMGNQIGKDGAEYIGKALERNTTVTWINLSREEISAGHAGNMRTEHKTRSATVAQST